VKKDVGRTAGYVSSDLLTEQEAADYLKWATATLRNRRAAKQAPNFIRLGTRSIRYRFGDLESFIENPAGA
jgi:hypothetical protein